MTTATQQAGATIALAAAKRRHGKVAFEAMGLYLDAWRQETIARPTTGMQLEEARKLYRKFCAILTVQGII